MVESFGCAWTFRIVSPTVTIKDRIFTTETPVAEGAVRERDDLPSTPRRNGEPTEEPPARGLAPPRKSGGSAATDRSRSVASTAIGDRHSRS